MVVSHALAPFFTEHSSLPFSPRYVRLCRENPFVSVANYDALPEDALASRGERERDRVDRRDEGFYAHTSSLSALLLP